jgi:glycosyltransferase involved in cell wall biosynthesis
MLIEIIIPAHNESTRIKKTLISHIKLLDKKYFGEYVIRVVMNGCNDDTKLQIMEVMRMFEDRVIIDEYTDAIHKGGAIIQGFKQADADIIGFVDADLSVNSREMVSLIEQLINSKADGVIASRGLPDSLVRNRSRMRLIISKGFNYFTRILFLINYSDTQCGAKFFKKDIIKNILPRLRMTNMTIDVDILFHAKKLKYYIAEKAVEWTDDKDTTIKSPIRMATTMFMSLMDLRLWYSMFHIGYYSIGWLFRYFWRISVSPAIWEYRYSNRLPTTTLSIKKPDDIVS